MNYSLPVHQPIQDDEELMKLDEHRIDVFNPALVPTKLNVITNSLRNTVLDCGMKYFFEYVRRLTPKVTPNYFVWGGFLHYAMERASYSIPMDHIQNELREKVEAVARAFPIGSLINQYEGFICLIPWVMDAYLLHYKSEYGMYENVVVEHQFSLPLGNTDTDDMEGSGWRFEGKLDTVIKNTQSGVIYVRDLKTPAATGQMFWDRLPLDSQMQGYVLAAQRAIGIHTNFAMYDVIKKPSMQKTLRCTDPMYWAEQVGTQYLMKHETQFERRVIEYPQRVIDYYFVELCMLARQLDFQQRTGTWIRHHPGNRIGGCPFFQVCVNGEDPTIMANYYERNLEDFNKELEVVDE